MILSRRQGYWICQIGGWGAYGTSLAAFYFYSDGSGFQINKLISIVVLCLTGFGLTHGFRLYVKRNNWLGFSQRKLVLNVLLANILMAVIYSSVNVFTEWSLHIFDFDKILWNEFIISVGMLIINATMLLLLWSVIYFAIIFFTYYRKEEIERLKWESSLKDFELNKLKSQLNPHFVFNALNGIRSLVEEEPLKAKESITQLSNLLRNSLLSDRAKTITLAEELRTVNDYLNLEKIRFEERLSVKFDIENKALVAQIPPMMIQTLVENAVKHGISKRTSGGWIVISGKIFNTFLVLEILNTGHLESLESGGFGIVNTRQRLELLFGKNSTFDIRQEDEQNVKAVIRIPLTNTYKSN